MERITFIRWNAIIFSENKAVGVMKPGHCFTIEPMISQGELSKEPTQLSVAVFPMNTLLRLWTSKEYSGSVIRSRDVFHGLIHHHDDCNFTAVFFFVILLLWVLLMSLTTSSSGKDNRDVFNLQGRLLGG